MMDILTEEEVSYWAREMGWLEITAPAELDSKKVGALYRLPDRSILDLRGVHNHQRDPRFLFPLETLLLGRHAEICWEGEREGEWAWCLAVELLYHSADTHEDAVLQAAKLASGEPTDAD